MCAIPTTTVHRSIIATSSLVLMNHPWHDTSSQLHEPLPSLCMPTTKHAQASLVLTSSMEAKLLSISHKRWNTRVSPSAYVAPRSPLCHSISVSVTCGMLEGLPRQCARPHGTHPCGARCSMATSSLKCRIAGGGRIE